LSEGGKAERDELVEAVHLVMTLNLPRDPIRRTTVRIAFAVTC
jgi:hypothetical protein